MEPTAEKTDDVQTLETPESSNIVSISYTPSTQRLVVKFKNATAYKYENVSEEAWDKFNMSESKGAHFAREIRPRYTGVKL